MPFNQQSLQELLDYTGISVRELAKLSGVHRANLARYMNGENTPQPEVLDKLYTYAQKAGAWHIEFYEKPVLRNTNIAECLNNVDSTVP